MSNRRGTARSRDAREVEQFLRKFAHKYSCGNVVSMPLRVLRVSACATFVVGCTALGSSVPPAQCLPLTAWTSAQQDAMREEYDALAKDAILRAVFMDWVAMRDADRACVSAGGK